MKIGGVLGTMLVAALIGVTVAFTIDWSRKQTWWPSNKP